MSGIDEELSRVVRDAVRVGTREGIRDSLQILRELADTAERPRKHADAPLDTHEAAELVGRSAKTILRWKDEGRLKPLGGPPYRWSREAVIAARDRIASSGNVLDLEEKADQILGRRQRNR